MARPFYLIAHNTNSMEEVRGALARGLNAVEIDIHADESGALYVSHYAVNALRRAMPGESPPPLAPFLDELKRFADSPAGSALALVILDCKVSDPALAPVLMTEVRSRLTERGTSLHVIVSVPSLARAAFFEPIRSTLTAHEALMIDEEDDPRPVAELFARAEVARAGYGNGITTIAGIGLPSAHLVSSMDNAVALRAVENLGFVYAWVVVDRETIRECLRIGVSGVMVDSENAERLIDVLTEAPFSGEYRRALRSDDPVESDDSVVLVVETADDGGAGTNARVVFSLELTDGSQVTKSVDGSQDGRFERSTRTYVTFCGKELAPDAVRSVTVSHDGSGVLPAWRLVSITLYARAAPVRRAWFDCTIANGTRATRAFDEDAP
jgi:glycerophosphoryl diester phosphodiesterase